MTDCMADVPSGKAAKVPSGQLWTCKEDINVEILIPFVISYYYLKILSHYYLRLNWLLMLVFLLYFAQITYCTEMHL